MLVLSRKIGEKVLIPQLNVEVIVTNVQGCKVKLGFVVPKEFGVYRSELLEEKNHVSEVKHDNANPQGDASESETQAGS